MQLIVQSSLEITAMSYFKPFEELFKTVPLTNNKTTKIEERMATYGSSSNSVTTGYTQNGIEKYLNDNFLSAIKNLKLDESEKTDLHALAKKFAEQASVYIEEKVSLSYMKNKLELLFEYEKHYLSLIKEFKEEIKFASSLQEEIRKERANFFSNTLREVFTTLQTTKVGPELESEWLQKLVASYTESLDLSAELAKENTLNRVSELKEGSKETKDDLEK